MVLAYTYNVLCPRCYTMINSASELNIETVTFWQTTAMYKKEA